MAAYYNENDKFAAGWLQQLIDAKLIASGEVDKRSIEDVTPDDVRGFTQCHFFAGIGGWSHALRLAGWPDDKPAWTGSCPCQPFSAAGKGTGAADQRHLWPAWFHLIERLRPSVIFGEQVAAAIKHNWLDAVQDDMEGIGYTFWAHGLAASNIGAPHQRKRLYFVADADGWNSSNRDVQRSGEYGLLAEGCELGERPQGQSELVKPSGRKRTTGPTGAADRLDNATAQRLPLRTGQAVSGTQACGIRERSGYVDGFWNPADWLWCSDGKYRPVEPDTFPLAYGLPARVGRLRGYGNAIVPQCAQAFIETYLEVTKE